jgi:hypothetical protein
MFIKIDNQTKAEEIISSETMASILEADLKPEIVDEALTDIVTGQYQHRNRDYTYIYRAE